MQSYIGPFTADYSRGGKQKPRWRTRLTRGARTRRTKSLKHLEWNSIAWHRISSLVRLSFPSAFHALVGPKKEPISRQSKKSSLENFRTFT